MPGGGWLIAPDGGFNVDHPLSPSYPGTPPVIPGGTEWQQHPVPTVSEECSPLQLNSRMSTSDQRVTVGGSSVQSVTGWPFSNTYDAAGNLLNDGRNIFRYDGSNRLKDVYTVAYSGGTPILGNKIAHFDYDALGRQVRSIYNTDGDSTGSERASRARLIYLSSGFTLLRCVPRGARQSALPSPHPTTAHLE